MLPQLYDDLRQDFVFVTLSSKTFRLDHDTNTIRGTVDQVKAVEQAIYLILNVERYEWLIYSWNYGVELKSLIGTDIEYAIPEIERRIRDALLQDDRITAVQDFKFQINKRKILTTFTVITIFSGIDVEWEVEI